MPETWEFVSAFSPELDWETVPGILENSEVIMITPEFARDPAKVLAKIVFRVTLDYPGLDPAYRTFGFWPQEFKGRIFDISLPPALAQHLPTRTLELKFIKPYRLRFKPPDIAFDDMQQMILNIERLL